MLTRRDPKLSDLPIITSLMDTDRYKFSMQKTFLHHYPAATAKYRFKCRNQGVRLGQYADEIRNQVQSLDSLTFTKDELAYCARIPSLAGDYIDFLRLFRLKMVECNGQPVAKLSDSPGKGMCESPRFQKYLEQTFQPRVGKRNKRARHENPAGPGKLQRPGAEAGGQCRG